MAKNNERVLTIAGLWNICIARWRWIVVSVVLSLLIAVYTILTSSFQYKRDATILVLEESLGKNAGDNSNDFNEIGFVRQKTNVLNVLREIKSLDVLNEVARRAYPELSESDIYDIAADMQDRLSVDNDGKSTVIDLSYIDSSTEMAYKILLLVIQVYGDRWIEHKLEVTRNTSKFIDERLSLLEHDLSIIDDSIAKYKSSYGITDVAQVSDLYLRKQNESDAEIMRLSSQKAMAEYIRELLEDKSNPNQLLLTNSGINNNGIEAQIAMYNNMVLDMQIHLKYTSEQNPAILHQQEQIEGLRSKILNNISNYINSLDIQLESLIDYYNEATTKVTDNPEQAKYLASIEREHKVKESLYQFLLQKKEENEISSTYHTRNIQIVEMPHGNGKPVSPKRMRILMGSLLLGFLIPVTVIFLRATLNETITNHHDVEAHEHIPFLAEVPMSERMSTIHTLQRFFGLKPEIRNIVVAEGKQTPINEAFRLIRTKLENVTSNSGGINGVYMVTSNLKDAGKTFVSMNLSITLAIRGYRVLFIDGDLRMGAASQRWKVSHHGLADYLEEIENDIAALLCHHEAYTTLDILPAGNPPSNPSELLDSPRLGKLVEEVRQLYDIVIIDTPPMGKLADAEIIGRQVDRLLFVLRAAHHKRSYLDNLEKLTDDYSNQSLYAILNGVNIDFRYDHMATKQFFSNFLLFNGIRRRRTHSGT